MPDVVRYESLDFEACFFHPASSRSLSVQRI